MHAGGWDEVLLFFGAPVTLFVFLRWLGIRKERREAADEANGSDGGLGRATPSEPWRQQDQE